MWKKNLDPSETIFALTSGGLPTAVAVLKISGPCAFELASQVFSPSPSSRISADKIPLEKKRAMVFGSLSENGEKYDDILLLSFVAPHSHTGDDTIEFHCHGSVAIVKKLENFLMRSGARPAERGEFSYRAFLNGKISAGELENLGDLYLARATSDLDRIYSRRDEGLSRQVAGLRSELLRLQAILDTAVDFSEEYSSVVLQAIQPLELAIHGCSAVIQRYSAFVQGNRRRIVFAGSPNAGKSSLFNALLCRYRAIVDSRPGTTRDVIEEDVEFGGVSWKLVDTAGIRVAESETESQGIALGEDYLEASDVWVLVVDGSVGASALDSALYEKYRKKPHLVVWNKSDLSSWLSPSGVFSDALPVSAHAGELKDFSEKLGTLVEPLTRVSDERVLPTATQVSRLQHVVRTLEELRNDLHQNVPPEYLGEKCRQSIAFLEAVIGEVKIDDVLDRLFGEFCIGK